MAGNMAGRESKTKGCVAIGARSLGAWAASAARVAQQSSVF
jgi:hypothetical protein